MTLHAGTKLGPYEILAPIGAGGMGEVYKATDTRLDRTVAVKVLPAHLAENPERIERLHREARAISQLSHPHICTLYDVGEQDGIDFIVMEYIEGDTLAARVEKGALRLETALEVAIQIADGLDAAHRTGIVHRDLKPANVMLATSGVKILDFGLARLAAGDEAVDSSDAPTRQYDLTSEESLIGTLRYMAPEQLERKPADARADIFAFGVVVFEMLTGRRAFEGDTQASLVSSIMSSSPRAVSAIVPDAPVALDHVVEQCLAKDPHARWQSVLDVRHELSWIARGSGAGEVATAPTTTGFSVPLALALLVLGLAAGATLRGFFSEPEPVGEPQTSLPEPVRARRTAPCSRHEPSHLVRWLDDSVYARFRGTRVAALCP